MSEIEPRIVHTRFYNARFTGKGEFYSGIATGDAVQVREETVVYSYDGKRKAQVHLACSNGGAWLALYDGTDQLEEVG